MTLHITMATRTGSSSTSRARVVSVNNYPYHSNRMDWELRAPKTPICCSGCSHERLLLAWCDPMCLLTGCNDMTGVASVLDNSCTACSGTTAADCSSATCATGYATYDGAGSCTGIYIIYIYVIIIYLYIYIYIIYNTYYY
jgi:hypothetical protein